MDKKIKNMNTEDIKAFIKNRALRCAGSCNSQSALEFNVLNELYSDLFGEPAVNTIPSYGFDTALVADIDAINAAVHIASVNK